ncbi:MAG: Asp-tRNA(Asn)/Glu-tRNA(Gln) amidotransferase subunit GatA [bacterium]|nr:Asp-tRNA(Asn)/Glu-tRNA(Gln) amidotransferase subunit GatA [bacterium]
MNLNVLTIKEAHKLLEKKEITSVELVKAHFNEIKKRDKDIHAFLSLNEEGALEAAKKVDERISRGEPIEMLAGIPAAIKDNISIKNAKVTAASKILENYIAPYDATVIKKLKKEEAIFIGKTNMDEFAMGSSTENSAFGPTRNPVDLERVPGGSSGGSAAAVKAGFSVYALGSDTGGSIRQPAGFCGVVGFKPTYGAVSRHGLIAMASSLDQIGPIARNVDDAAAVFEIIRGVDELDSTSVSPATAGWQDYWDSTLDIEEIKIGVPREYFIHGLNPEIEKNIKSVISKLEKEGAKIEEISLPYSEWALATYYIIMPAEASANLARFDGIKYGYSTMNKEEKLQSLLDVYLQSRGRGFGTEVRQRIMLGTYILSAGYYDAYYTRAQRVRKLIKQDFDHAFKEVDVILTPTSPTTAFKFGEKTQNPLSMYLADIYTVSVNLAGVPGISIPIEEVDGLPVGLQLIGKNFDDVKLLKIAKIIETLSK